MVGYTARDMSKLRKPTDKYKGLLSHKRSGLQEREIAKNLGAKLVPRSGAGKQKGDVRDKGFLRIEAKTTLKKSFSVTRDMYEKIETAAMSHDEVPVIVIEFLDEQGNPESELAVMPTWAIKGVIE